MNALIEKLIKTDDDLNLLLARLFLGIVIFPHGAQKLFGWFGGYGFSGTMNFFTGNGMPAFVAFLVIMAESLGALALIAGFIGRFMAFGIGLVMTGAIFMMHLNNGFFMNWSGKQAGEGYEFHILAIALALIVIIKGSGKFSIDGFLGKFLAE